RETVHTERLAPRKGVHIAEAEMCSSGERERRGSFGDGPLESCAARTYQRGARLKGPQSPERSTLHGMNVVGLDLSLTGSGIAAIDPHTRELATAVHSSAPPADDNLTCHTRRHRTLVDGIVRQVLACDPVLVVVEGLQFSVKAKDSSLTRRGFLWWAVIEALCDAGVPVLEVSPSQIKKFATGKGNASKAEVVAAYAVAWPNAAHTRGVEDRADASFAAALGAAWLGLTGLPLRNTAARRQVLKGLSRPSSPLRQLRISNASDTAA
ncbi:RuvC family protein, partial [Mycobacteroides abscessus]